MSTNNEQVTQNTDETPFEATTILDEESGKTVKLVDAAVVDKALRASVYASMGLGIVPSALFNIATVTTNNLALARKLSNLYGVEFKEGAAKKIIAGVLGAGVGTLATPFVESVVGLVPVIGWPLVIGTRPALNGMTSYALGRMFVTHFENGGTFVGANMDVMKQNFETAFKNSRQWLGDAIKGKEEVSADA